MLNGLGKPASAWEVGAAGTCRPGTRPMPVAAWAARAPPSPRLTPAELAWAGLSGLTQGPCLAWPLSRRPGARGAGGLSNTSRGRIPAQRLCLVSELSSVAVPATPDRGCELPAASPFVPDVPFQKGFQERRAQMQTSRADSPRRHSQKTLRPPGPRCSPAGPSLRPSQIGFARGHLHPPTGRCLTSGSLNVGQAGHGVALEAGTSEQGRAHCGHCDSFVQPHPAFLRWPLSAGGPCLICARRLDMRRRLSGFPAPSREPS